ncbi:hypothetical protein FRX31_035106 [Thalictrum thalictroides]|uniref:Uncharacterized protein n=1 Tax=Thalictrum thalictroides TaxID=46969 RepID=A0A7J6URZ8_THATH|nr:hypothetical protein FRX31_035106 [Thalictrum thalictroides]
MACSVADLAYAPSFAVRYLGIPMKRFVTFLIVHVTLDLHSSDDLGRVEVVWHPSIGNCLSGVPQEGYV